MTKPRDTLATGTFRSRSDREAAVFVPRTTTCICILEVAVEVNSRPKPEHSVEPDDSWAFGLVTTATGQQMPCVRNWSLLHANKTIL